MTKLEWGTTGNKFYEAGIDRGVLYVGGAGVPWDGLVSVDKDSQGGEAKPIYFDGVKFSNRLSAEEYEATLTAFTYPDEFAQCDGSVQIGNGLFATHQRRKSFDLCYRTKVGNDVDGAEHAYKIHLVYGVTASPSERNYATIADSTDATNFAWKLSSKPPALAGHRRTSYFVIDSREISPTLLARVEEILYGNISGGPRIPSVGELAFLFTNENSHVHDAGHLGEEYFITYDGGHIPAAQTTTLDGGGVIG